MRRTTAFGLYAVVCLTTAAVASGDRLLGDLLAVSIVVASVLVFGWMAYRFLDASKELAADSIRGRRGPEPPRP